MAGAGAVRLDERRHREPGRRHRAFEAGTRVAAEVPDELVGGAEALGMGGHAEYERPAGRDAATGGW